MPKAKLPVAKKSKKVAKKIASTQRDTNKNKVARTRKAVKETKIELKNPTQEGLSPMEEEFCRLYVSATEFYGNGTQSYIEAFKVEIILGKQRKREHSKYKQMTIEAVRTAAYWLLTHSDVLTRINEIMEEGGFNDQFADKMLKHLMTQQADPRVQLAALTEYNKLKARIVSRESHLHSFSNDDMSDEELMNRVEAQRKFFTKQ